MPDESESPKNLPARHRPRLSELSKQTTEEDLWDLEDSEPAPKKLPEKAVSMPVPAKHEEEKESRIPEIKEVRTEPRGRQESDSVTSRQTRRNAAPSDTQKAVPLKPSRPNEPKAHDPKATTPLPPEPEVVEAPAPEKPSQEPEAPAPKEEEAKSAPTKPEATAKAPATKAERLGLISCGVALLILAIWWIAGLFSSIKTTRLGDDQPEFPAEGSFVVIEKAETYWRSPVRDGASPDVARREVEFIPVLSVEIADSESGVLRAIFRNEQGEFVGDSISKNFANGVFDQNSDGTVEFPATDGFANAGEYNGYRVGSDRWTVELFEGPSANASGSDFKLLFTAPISPNRQ